MVGAKAAAAGVKLSGRQSTKRKRAPKRVRRGVAGVSGSGDGGSGVGSELDGVADKKKFIGVRGSPKIVEIKNYLEGRNLYMTVKGGTLEAAIIHDVALVHVDPSYPEKGLNILEVVQSIQKEAQIVHRPIDKRYVVEFTERHPLKLEVSNDEQFVVLKEEIKKQGRQCFLELKEEIKKQGRQCFLELKEEITGDREHHVQGRQRKDLDRIPLHLAEEDVPQEDDRVQALKDKVEELVAEHASSNRKLPRKAHGRSA